MLKYKEYDIDISTTNYSNGVAIIPLPNNEIICIPEENATIEQLNIIQQIKHNVEKRPKPEPVEVKQTPTQEQRISDLELLALQLGGVI